MSKLPQQFIEDRALRDAALGVLRADIEHARMSLSGKGMAARVGSRVGDGAKDVFEVAKVHADDNRGILAALIGALVLFFAREPILEIFGITPSDDEEETADFEGDNDSETLESEHGDGDAERPPLGENNER